MRRRRKSHSKKTQKRSFRIPIPWSSTIRDRLWLGVFGFWLLALTGALAPLTGAPGLYHYLAMGQSIDKRRDVIKDLETQRDQLEQDLRELQTNPLALEREIRRVLGYARRGEMIFEFATPHPSPAPDS